MYITRLIDGAWTEPVAIHHDNWEIMGCPVNGPRIEANGLKLAVAWYTSSPYSRVNVVFSEDAGATFSKAIEVNQNESIGRVDIGWLDENSVFATYMEGDTIKGAVIDQHQVLKRKNLVLSLAARASGFPQMEVLEGDVILAWTDSEAEEVKTMMIDPND